MKTIYKYQLYVVPKQTLQLHDKSIIQKCTLQDGEICIWVECDTDEQLSNVDIEMYYTGEELNTKRILTYMNTVEINKLVYHIFLSNPRGCIAV